MITYKKHYSIEPPLCDRDWILKKAKEALFKPIPHITDITAPILIILTATAFCSAKCVPAPPI